LYELVTDVVEAFEYQIRLKGLNFYVYFDILLPLEIKSDENRIKQILFNLVQNAVKFTKHGHIKIIVRKVQKKQVLKKRK